MRGMTHATYAQGPTAPVETPPAKVAERPVYVRPVPAPRRPLNQPSQSVAPSYTTTPGPTRGPAFDVSFTAQIGILALLALFLFMKLNSS